MDKEMQAFIDTIIQDRMQQQFGKRSDSTSQGMLPEEKKLEAAYQNVLQGLSPENQKIVEGYVNMIFDDGADNEGFYYRLGMKDGIRLQKWMKKILKSVS